MLSNGTKGTGALACMHATGHMWGNVVFIPSMGGDLVLLDGLNYDRCLSLGR